MGKETKAKKGEETKKEKRVELKDLKAKKDPKGGASTKKAAVIRTD